MSSNLIGGGWVIGNVDELLPGGGELGIERGLSLQQIHGNCL